MALYKTSWDDDPRKKGRIFGEGNHDPEPKVGSCTLHIVEWWFSVKVDNCLNLFWIMLR